MVTPSHIFMTDFSVLLSLWIQKQIGIDRYNQAVMNDGQRWAILISESCCQFAHSSLLPSFFLRRIRKKNSPSLPRGYMTHLSNELYELLMWLSANSYILSIYKINLRLSVVLIKLNIFVHLFLCFLFLAYSIKLNVHCVYLFIYLTHWCFSEHMITNLIDVCLRELYMR